jgi:LytS/YehU family sensor histidine kinase
VVEQKLIAKSANAQFESLKNQLDPHFLFNSLNVLSSLIDENPNQAQKFTASMSKIYRYVLEQKDKELVTVEDEIEFAKTYCDLLKQDLKTVLILFLKLRKKIIGNL